MLPLLLPLFLLLLLSTPLNAQSSSKRGLTYFSPTNPNDDHALLSADTPLTWYYTYQSQPSDAITGLEFVPMLWGDHPNTFTADVMAQLPAVKYVLGFNEPEMSLDVGGSSITPGRAAEIWRSDIEPLKGMVKLGAPAVSSAPSGMDWLKRFFAACGDCTFDFIPIHWYGNFEGLASHLGNYHVTFPDKKLWITELGYAHQDLQTTEDFFNATMSYLDGLDYVERYSWFGFFRAGVSNVGPSGAMLDDNGQLTDIGRWYLGVDGAASGAASGAAVLRWRLVIGMGVGAVIWGML